MSVRLNAQNLTKKKIATPPLQPTQSKICHIGLSNFHRSHQAFYTQNTMNLNQDSRWGITAIGLLPGDIERHIALKKQNNLYSLRMRSATTSQFQIIGALYEILHTYEDYKKIINKIADPATTLITLTVTEGGYFINQRTGELDFENPSLQHDLKNDTSPKTIYGLLREALKQREISSSQPITLLSCDNIPSNGKKFQTAFKAFLEASDVVGVSSGWFAEELAFPDSMVDRITINATVEDKRYCQSQGIIDEAPVVSEDFVQWIIEDHFLASRPLWELAGAQFVSNIEPYENIKLRLLNASHTVLALSGALMGYEYVDAAIHDPLIKKIVQRFMAEEAAPTLVSMPGMVLEAYQPQLIKRFSNQAIADKLERIISFTSDKMISFLLPTCIDNVANGGNYHFSTFTIASWAHYLQRYALGQDSIKELQDLNAEKIVKMAANAIESPATFLKDTAIFGSLSQSEGFVECFVKHFEAIKNNGIKKALSQALDVN